MLKYLSEKILNNENCTTFTPQSESEAKCSQQSFEAGIFS